MFSSTVAVADFLLRRYSTHHWNVCQNSLKNVPPGFLRAESDGVTLSIKVQPRASTNEIGEPLGNELGVKVTAPSVDSAANEALIRLLAETLDCPRNRIELIRGQTSRHKILKLHGISAQTVLTKLRA